MLTLRLDIDVQPARLGLESSPAKLRLEVPQPRLDIQQRWPQVQIQRRPPVLEIEPNRELPGWRRPLQQARKAAAEAQRAVLDGIARVAQEGDRLAQIERGASVAEVVAGEAGWWAGHDLAEFNVALVPPAPPEVRVVPGQLDIAVQPGAVTVRSPVEFVRGSVQPGEVRIQLLQAVKVTVRAVPVAEARRGWIGSRFDRWA